MGLHCGGYHHPHVHHHPLGGCHAQSPLPCTPTPHPQPQLVLCTLTLKSCIIIQLSEQLGPSRHMLDSVHTYVQCGKRGSCSFMFGLLFGLLFRNGPMLARSCTPPSVRPAEPLVVDQWYLDRIHRLSVLTRPDLFLSPLFLLVVGFTRNRMHRGQVASLCLVHPLPDWQLLPSAGDCMGRGVSHCGLLVGRRRPHSFHHCPDSGYQLLPQQEASQASVVQQRLQQHSVVHLCQGESGISPTSM